MNPNLSTTVFTRFEDADGRRIWEKVPAFQMLAPKPSELLRDARFHPFRWSIAEGVMDWVALSSKDYAAASFLDRRALSVTSSDHYFSMPIANASTCPEEHPNNLRWIFHVGHCGSTALSKLLGFHPEVLSLREPGFLWGLNALWRDDPTSAPEWFPLCQAILKRGFEATSTVLVKPSSLQTELCLKLLQADKPSPCIVLTSSLQHYLLNALKDGLDDSVSSDFESGASDAISFWRRQQLADIPEETPPSLHPRLYKASLAWLGVVTQLGHAIQTGSLAPEQLLWLDHDELLVDSERVGIEALEHLGLPVKPWRNASPASTENLGKSGRTFDAEDYQNRRRAVATTYQSKLRAHWQWLGNLLTRYPQLTSSLEMSAPGQEVVRHAFACA